MNGEVCQRFLLSGESSVLVPVLEMPAVAWPGLARTAFDLGEQIKFDFGEQINF